MVDSLFIPDVVDESPDGVFANHPERVALPVMVAPAAGPAALNTFRKPLVTVACANLPDRHFAFDSSVVAPEAKPGFAKLAALVKRHPGCPASVFGHSDPVGNDVYNKALSERRARAIFALLLRRPGVWERLFANQEGAIGDVWGLRSVQLMLDFLGFTPGTGDGKMDAGTRDAIVAFQRQQNAPPTGANDPALRRILFAAYMDAICQDAEGKDFRLAPEDFLGLGKGKGDFQGCSRFNPQLILAQREAEELAKAGDEGKAVRNAANEPDRRVIIFLFASGTRIDPKKWPCPSAAEGVQGCLDRFWSDGEKRRKTQFVGHRREFGRSVPAAKAVLKPADPDLVGRMAKSETTFGCRFYHGLALHSPCERDLKLWVVRLMVDAENAASLKVAQANRKVPLANARFVAKVGDAEDAPLIRGTSSENGIVAIPVFDETVRIVLRLDAFAGQPGSPPAPKGNVDSAAFPDEEQFVTVRLDGGSLKRIGPAGDADPDEPPPAQDEIELGVRQRLYNLGYGNDNFADWGPEEFAAFLKRFQQDNPPLPATGSVDDATIARLAESHGS